MAVILEKEGKWTKDKRKYYFKVYYKDIYGKRKQYKSKLYKNSTECKNAERKYLIDIKNKTNNNENILFKSVFNEWLEYKKNSLKSSTFYGLKTTLNKHILPYFCNYKIHDIKLNTINNWTKEFNKKNYSISYKNNIIGYLKEILIYARDLYNYDMKIIMKIQKLKEEETKITRKKDSEINFWTLEEFNTFIKYVENPFYNLIFNFLYYTGLRKGEMYALNWNDIDFENKSLSVDKTLVEKVEGKDYIITIPKTENSKRIIDLSDKLVILLENHYKNEKNIYNFNKNMFVFGNVKHIASTTLARQLQKYIDLAKVKRITPHGFRHSHASLLINLGCDSREVAERLGDTVQMVEDTYIHMFPNKKKHTINLLNKV